MNNTDTTFKNLLNVQISSVATTPFWFPFFSLNLIKKSEILFSKSIGCIAHTNFFKSFKDLPHLYRGYGLTLAFQPMYPLVIGLQQHYVNEKNSFVKNLGITALISGSSAIIANPLDVFILKLQKKQLGESSYQVIKNLVNNEGCYRLFRGTSVFAVRNATFGSSLLIAQPYISKLFNSNNSIFSAFVSSCIGNTIAVPAEIVSVMRQSPNYLKLSAFDCLKHVYKKHGIRGFLTGVGYKISANTIEIYLFHEIYNRLKKVY